jgi:AbrB family looped-hinge helix DNA binding protein
MEIAKVTSKGQITIPIDIRKKLGVREGSKVVFIEEESGKIIVTSAAEATKKAFAELREAFAGEAERLGLKDEQDVVAMVKEVRAKIWEEKYADKIEGYD